MATILHYINVRRATIFQYVVDWPIYEACRGEERRRGLLLQQWWWEQKMSLDNADADGANKLWHLGQVEGRLLDGPT
jgi:hypothetical protein